MRTPQDIPQAAPATTTPRSLIALCYDAPRKPKPKKVGVDTQVEVLAVRRGGVEVHAVAWREAGEPGGWFAAAIVDGCHRESDRADSRDAAVLEVVR